MPSIGVPTRFEPPRRRLAGLALGLALGAGLGACFDGDYLAYAPCEASAACHEAGMVGCVRIPSTPEALGFCAPACAGGCPQPIGGDADPICVTLDAAEVCVLSCAGDVTCPGGMACVRVQDQDQAARDLCFPESAS